MEIMKRISSIFNKHGFKAIATPKEVLVELSSKDVAKVMSVYEQEGLEGVDKKILDYGRKLEAMAISGFNRVAVKIDGYKVDEDSERIFISVIPKNLSLSKLAKDKEQGEDSMADDEKKEEKKEEKKPDLKEIKDEKKDEKKEPKEDEKKEPKEPKEPKEKKEVSTSPEEVAVKEYEEVEKEFRKTLLEEVPVQEAVGIAHDILQDQGEISPKMESKIRDLHKRVAKITREQFSKDAVTKDEVDTLVNDAVNSLRNSPMDMALTTMQDVIKNPEGNAEIKSIPEVKPKAPNDIPADLLNELPIKEEKPIMEKDKLLESKRRHMASLRRKLGQGFDPVTDIYTGKDEGPFPTMNTDEIKKPNPSEEVTLSEEAPGKQKLDEMPTLSQEAYKKKSDRVNTLIKKAKDNGSLGESDVESTYDILMTYSDKKLDEYENIININEGIVLQEGKIADLNEMFGEE